MLEWQQKVRQKGEGFPAGGTPGSRHAGPFLDSGSNYLTFADAMPLECPTATGTWSESILVLCQRDYVW